MIAEVTFSIEISEEEARALGYVMDGRSDLEIAHLMRRAPLKVTSNFSEWNLNLNLIQATRDGLVRWVVHREWKRETG